MVTDITTHAALDTGQLQCAHQAFSLRASLKTCLELFRPSCAEKGLELELQIADNLPPVLLGDEFRLRQALGNLVGNAVKFTEHGGIRVHAEGENMDGDEYMLHLKVRDTGPGIAAEEQARIFERFARGDQGQMHCTPGTGLGLAITRELAGLMRGALSLESRLGEGSCFTLSLRCALPAKTAGAPVCRDASSERYPKTTGAQEPSAIPARAPKALCIVLAEDNKVSAYFLQEILQQAGHSVAVAGDGFDALALLRNTPVDLAILDIHMPGMNGLELAQCIRKGDAGVDPALPIISITASRSEEMQTRLRQLDVRVQAEKPLGAGQLLQLIAEAYGNNDARNTERDMETVFDLVAALARVDGKHTLLRKLAGVLLEELPLQEQALAQAMEQNNLAHVHHLAHALKNSAAMLHLLRLQATGAALEYAALARQDCRRAWQSLQEAMPVAQSALRAYVDSRMHAI
jgi:CheY-like chemotaxis protein